MSETINIVRGGQGGELSILKVPGSYRLLVGVRIVIQIRYDRIFPRSVQFTDLVA
jgi:hypothetical protein